MLEDSQDIAILISETDFECFCSDMKTRKAVIMSLLNIGELASHLAKDYTDANPEMPWKQMIGMRNFAAHGYHTMNLSIVWDTVNNFVPALAKFLEAQLSVEG
jgi:uncharacterized protein with HEPN domain